VLLALALAPAPAQAVLPQGNLIRNPGAEEGAGAIFAGMVVALPGWTRTGSFTPVRYGSAGFPSAAQGAAVSGGQNFFAGGPDNANSSAYQVIGVAAAASEIDSGQLTANLGAELGGTGTDADEMTVSAVYLSAGGARLGTLALNPISDVERSGETKFIAESEEGLVPKGTRAIAVLMGAGWRESPYNDAYADNLELSLGPAPPELGRAVNVSAVRGKVFVRVAGGGSARASQSKGRGFVPLSAPRQIPVGSTLDTRKGTVRLTSAANASGKTQTGDFTSSVFQVRQSRKRSAKGMTTLRLKGSSFRRCGKAGRSSIGARTSRTRTIRRLRGNAKGRFQTRGRYASATVRGTVWTTTDRCDGTLTTVRRGKVTVRDFRRRKTILLRAGRSYLAR